MNLKRSLIPAEDEPRASTVWETGSAKFTLIYLREELYHVAHPGRVASAFLRGNNPYIRNRATATVYTLPLVWLYRDVHKVGYVSNESPYKPCILTQQVTYRCPDLL